LLAKAPAQPPSMLKVHRNHNPQGPNNACQLTAPPPVGASPLAKNPRHPHVPLITPPTATKPALTASRLTLETKSYSGASPTTLGLFQQNRSTAAAGEGQLWGEAV
jgi:hypothetical protein